MALVIRIDTGNAAFDEMPGDECARILRNVATSLERGAREGRLHDHNGNAVGQFKLAHRNGRNRA